MTEKVPTLRAFRRVGILTSKREKTAMSISSPAVITAAVVRSILQALGMEQVVIDFIAITAIGTLAVLSAILLVGIRSSRSIRPK